MTNHQNDDASGSDLPGDHAAIDAIARRAGAEVRRPAPAAFAAGVRRARRRQQTIRAGLGAVGVAALVTVGAVAVAGRSNDSTLVPATAPTVEAPTTVVTTPDTTPATTNPESTTPDGTSPVAAPPDSTTSTAPPAVDVDAVPEAIYAPADDATTQQDVFDPVTLELVDTRPSTGAAFPDPTAPVTSASGAITYGFPYDQQDDMDPCLQMPAAAWVVGAEPTGLPERVEVIAVSADGRAGVAVSAACPTDGALAGDDQPAGPYDVTIAMFDADDPTTSPRPILTIDGGAEGVLIVELNDDGSLLLLTTASRPFSEGPTGLTRIIDTASGDLVSVLGDGQPADLPHSDCATDSLQFVGTSGLAYMAICPDIGLAVVIHDLRTGETIDVVNSDYIDRTYETMPTASLIVDPATYTSPANAWYVLCAGRSTVGPDGSISYDLPGTRPCWLGHGADAMREISTATNLEARFTPY